MLRECLGSGQVNDWLLSIGTIAKGALQSEAGQPAAERGEQPCLWGRTRPEDP